MSERRRWRAGRAILLGALTFFGASWPFVFQKSTPSRNLTARARLCATRPSDMAWLESKQTEEGVTRLPSGLMYKVLEEGPAGGPSPQIDEKCSCTYAGQLTNGKEFDSGTIDFAPNQVIPGWTEAMQLMKEGDRWELYIPSELAYGERGAGAAIPPGAALQFQMKINKVGGSGPFDALLGLFR
eukprot:TRINITY_DN37647_c0_g1_i1.p1 TRINITY_DN37647_c0_g1~~TRINITY_DN37647_c0_g1_i1.p1  ORF type:complete len:184 (-),score=24.60 TRINITY_DN37647_c0_g1_i1:22-573(-)